MATAIFPTRYGAAKAASQTHTQAADIHVVRIHQDNTPDGRTGFAVEREDWNMAGIKHYLQEDGTWGKYASEESER